MRPRKAIIIGIAAFIGLLALLLPPWDSPEVSRRLPSLAAVNRVLNHAIPWRRNLASYLVDAGRQAQELSDNDRAREFYEKALRLAPDSVKGLEQLLRIQVLQNDLKAANDTAARLERIDPDNPRVLNQKGYDLAAQGRIEEAVKAYRRGRPLGIRDLNVLLNQQEVLVQTGQYDRAEWLTEQASALMPNESSFDNNLAWWYQQRSVRLPVALRHAQRALRIKPDDASSRDTLAWVFMRMGKLDEAADEANQGLSVKRIGESEILLGILRSRQGRFDEAVQHFRRGYANVARDPYVRRVAEEEIKGIDPKLNSEQRKALRLLEQGGRRSAHRRDFPPPAPPGKAALSPRVTQ